MTKDSVRSSYVHGYTTASSTMSTRSSENFAAFFTPYLKTGMTVLDVGCGPGTISVGLASAVAPGKFTGIDIGQSEIERATDNALKASLSNAEFKIAEATNLPFDDQQFDAVFSCAVLEHVPEAEAALSEIHRVLKQGGIFGIKSGFLDNLVFFPRSEHVVELFRIYRGVWEANGGHPNFGADQVPLIEQAGFKDLKITGFYEPRLPSEDFAIRIVEPTFIARATELGLSNEVKLRQLSDQLRKYAVGEDEGSETRMTLVPWIEVLATK